MVITFLCRVLWVPEHQILNHCSSSRFIKNSVCYTCCCCAIGSWNNCLNFLICRLDLLKVQSLSFFIKFNVLYLGALFFALLFLGGIMERFRRILGTGWMWATEYLNGNYILFLYVFLLILAVISYCYSLWKTWKLTKSDTLFNKTRVLAFGWLLGAPTFIFFTAIYWVSAMQVFVDFLFSLRS